MLDHGTAPRRVAVAAVTPVLTPTAVPTESSPATAAPPPDRQASAYPVAGVRVGAVGDGSGRHNPPATVRHRRRPEQATVGPEVADVTVRSDVHWLQVRFTDSVREDGVELSGFGYHTSDGRFLPAKRIVTAHDRDVVVGFSAAAGDRVNEAVRIVVAPDSARSDPGIDSTLAVVPGPASDGTTAATDLVDAEQRSPTRVAFQFDEVVEEVDPGGFWVRAVSGHRHRATEAALDDGGRTVVAVLPQMHDLRGELAVAAVGPEAARSADRAAIPVTYGVVTLPREPTTGVTPGPDLVDAGSDAVIVAFDHAADTAVAALLPEAAVQGEDGLWSPAAFWRLP
jgi:hypothetical protein